MGALIAAHLDELVGGLRALAIVVGVVAAAMGPPILSVVLTGRSKRRSAERNR